MKRSRYGIVPEKGRLPNRGRFGKTEGSFGGMSAAIANLVLHARAAVRSLSRAA